MANNLDHRAESSRSNATKVSSGSDEKSMQQSEGKLAKAIETQTAKLPSDVFLWAAGASIIASLALQLGGMKQKSMFVGQWPAAFLLLGIYNKIVKVAGSDRTDAKIA